MSPDTLALADGVECLAYANPFSSTDRDTCFITRSLVDGKVFYRGRSPINAQMSFNNHVAPEFRIAL